MNKQNVVYLLSNGVPLLATYKINYILTNVGSKGKVPLIRIPAIWGDGGLNVPPQPPPFCLVMEF